MTIPLRGYRGVALVEVQVNRKYSDWFLFDTGAKVTVICDAAARKCGLRPHLMRLNVFMLGKGLVEARPVVIDDLRLAEGAFSTKNLLAYVLPDAEFEGDYAGILGMDVISQMGIFSVNASRLTLHRKLPAMRSSVRLPAIVRSRECLPFLRLGDGQPISFLWDTGSGTNYFSPNILPSQLQRRGGRSSIVPANGSKLHQVLEDGTEVEVPIERKKLWRFGEAKLGTVSINPFLVYHYPQVLGWSQNRYGILGFPLLTEYEITADFVNARLYMQRYRWNLAGTYGLSLSADEAKGKLRWFLGYEIPLGEGIPALPRTAELLAVDGIPVDAWETIPLIQRLMFPKARQSCSVKYFDGRKVAVAALRAVGVPYFGMPLFYFHGVSLPKTEFKFEGGLVQSQMVLEIPKAVKGVRGVRRRLQVEYRDYTWNFRY